MKDTEESARHEPTTIQAEKAIERILIKIDLISFFPKELGKKAIAILGAGTAVESGALRNYFMGLGLKAPEIIAYDKDPAMKKATESVLKSRLDNGFEYKVKDLFDPSSFDNESFDLILIRKPDVHNSGEVWKKIIRNGFDHLKQGGIMLVTTDMYRDFVASELEKNGKILKTHRISDSEKVGPFITEEDLFIARK